MRVLVLSLLLAVSVATLAGAQPLGQIWTNGRGSVVVTTCPPGGDTNDTCRAVEVRRGPVIDKLGGGYIEVNVLWTRPPGASGPDLLIFGDDGGSGGDGDLFAVTLTPAFGVRKFSGERMTSAAVHPGPHGEPLKVDLAFDIEFFNGGSHADATIVPLPVQWQRGDFALDLKRLTGRTFSPGELDFQALAIRSELDRWSQDYDPTARLFPPESRFGSPVTVRALVGMMLAGHADQARQLLDRSWPSSPGRTDRKLGGEGAFWSALCTAVVRHPLWQRFDIGRVPHADLIDAGAKAAAH